MQLGMIGLGRMGGNMVRRLMRGGHTCVVFDRARQNVEELVAERATGAESLDDFVHKLPNPRVAWVMVPAGQATEATVVALSERMDAGDIIVDGGNSYFKDDVRRSELVSVKGIHYVDVGTSGGVWGLDRGYCLMIGGPKQAADYLIPIFKTLAPGQGSTPPSPGREHMRSSAEDGFLHCGPSGSGHFVKMVHNGIEYGVMQAYAEGFDIMRGATSKDLAARCNTTSTCRTLPSSGVVVASSPPGCSTSPRRRSPRARSFKSIPVLFRTPERGAGRSRPRSKKASPAMFSRRRCMHASVRASSIPLRRRCCRRCVTSSVVTSSPEAESRRAHSP